MVHKDELDDNSKNKKTKNKETNRRAANRTLISALSSLLPFPSSSTLFSKHSLGKFHNNSELLCRRKLQCFIILCGDNC